MLKHLIYLLYQLTPASCFHPGNEWFLTRISNSSAVHSQSAWLFHGYFQELLFSLDSVGMMWITVRWSNRFGNQQPLFVLHMCWSTCPYHLRYSSLSCRVEKGNSLSHDSVNVFHQNALPEGLDRVPVAALTKLFLCSFKTHAQCVF